MKKILSALFVTALLAGAVSCNSFLDLSPHDSVSDRAIWEKVETAEYAVNDAYSYIYDIFRYQGGAYEDGVPGGIGMTESLTDQLKYNSTVNFAMALRPSVIAYGGDLLTATFINTNLGVWDACYERIRKVNQDLNSLRTYGTGLEEEDAARLEGELRLVRAWLYFELMKRYKEVILYDEDLTAITQDKAVSTEAEGWTFIATDLAFAEEHLPVKAAARGRLDRGMAYALATRALLYAKDYAAVIAAAKEVATLGYDLEDDYADSYSVAINKGNAEAILQYTFDAGIGVSHQWDYYYAPPGDYAEIGMNAGGYGVPTQEMVESYELADGSGVPDWSAWHTTAGTTATPPYEDLEPRFQATVLYNGADWKSRTIEPYVGGKDGWTAWRANTTVYRTTTGYYLRKFCDETHDPGTSASTQPFTLLRYGEVLLNKAEACYRSGDEEGANTAVRAIRARVGLPYADLTGDALWTAIRQERRIELAYEGLWYWDLRRWGVAAEDYPAGLNRYRVHGLRIEPTATEGEFLYTYVLADDADNERRFPERMYRFPMPESELASNGLVTQYPEWR